MVNADSSVSSKNTVTLADVAARVGVSARTVSRVVNGEGGCTPATRDRITDAIEELNYRPNLMARGLIRKRSDTIGLVAAEMLDPFFPEIAEGVQRAARRFNRTMFLASTDSDADRQRQVLASLHGHGVDGVIVFPAWNSHADLTRTARRGLPIVIVNEHLTDDLVEPNIASVRADIQRGAELGVAHLIDTGRRRIAFLTDKRLLEDARVSRRGAGYRTQVVRAGLAIDESLIVGNHNSLDGGRQGVRQLLALADPPDAIFAYNDLMALGALQELLVQGRRVPDDVAVIGFDDIAMCDAVTPRLSSIRIDRDLLGQTAVETLQAMLGDPNARRATAALPVELIVRDSS